MSLMYLGLLTYAMSIADIKQRRMGYKDVNCIGSGQKSMWCYIERVLQGLWKTIYNVMIIKT